MPPKRVSVVIHRPVEDVFAYMNDVAREPEWQPRLVSAEESAGPVGIGTERRYASEFMGRRVENTYVIRVWEPNARLVVESTGGSALEATTEVLWATVAEGTRVTMAVDGKPRGALKLVPRALLEGTFERELTESLSLLKKRLEAGG